MTDHLQNIPLVTGVIFLLAAVVQKMFPPRNINSLYGYRTAASGRSQQHWDFAQRYSTNRMFEAAALLIICGVVMTRLELSHKTQLTLGLSLLLLFSAYMIVRTEFALKKKFPK